MSDDLMHGLRARGSPAARCEPLEAGWRLSIPAGPAGTYRLAQLDDHAGLPRRQLVGRPPLTLRLRARASAMDLPGTWGFGLWNDPFGLSLGFGGTAARLPTLPNAAWFFHASPENHLSFRDDLPGHGMLAATFRSPRWPPLLLAPALPGLPLLAVRPLARIARRLAGRIIRQDAVRLDITVTVWHEYRLEWTDQAVKFYVDDRVVLRTPVSPPGPLGLILWIDNQFAAFTPEGRLRWGMLANESAWLELESLEIKQTQ